MEKKRASLTGKDIMKMQDKLKSNDNEAVKILIDSNKGLINTCVNSFITSQNKNSLDDYMQEAMHALLNAGKKYDYEKNKSFYNFAKMVITNTLIDLKRQEGKCQENEMTMRNSEDLGNLMDYIITKNPPPTLLDEIVKKEQLDAISALIKAVLTEREYEIMLLFYHENLSYKDISTKLSIEQKTVDNTLQSAKRKLKANKELEKLLLNSNWLREK